MGTELPKIDDFKLSQELKGHSGDVRVVASSKDLILSGSRDKTVRVWKKADDGTFKEDEVLTSHTNYVSSVCVFNDGNWIATGGNDKKIFVYNLDCLQPFASIEEHENTVCCLANDFANPKVLLSSSWDKTARIFTFEDTKYTSVQLKEHEQAVWTIVALRNGKYATGSADKNIFVWNSAGERLVVLNGHTDCVRGLVAVGDNLLSCSNDATIRLWNVDTYECLREFFGHSNYIYSIALLSDNLFISGSEDNTVRLWALTGEKLGELKLPVQSVWSVTSFHGDIVAGTNDGLVRVFTRDQARFASEEVTKHFVEAVASRESEAAKEIGGVKVNDLPGPEALYQDGKEGQTKMIRQPSGKVMCYVFKSGFWECIGDVMGATENSKSLLDGKEYDFVFNVDIEDGAPPLKLGYNKTDDPWHAAQKFIHANDLPQVYLEQVANFIITNANITTLPATNDPNFADPFTGGGRYVPGSGTPNPLGQNTSTTDPFNGGGRYVPSTAQNPLGQNTSTTDPFTGSGRYIPSQPASDVNFRQRSGVDSGNDELMLQRHIPSKTPVFFDSIVVQKVVQKLREFNGQMEGQSKMNEAELILAFSIMDNPHDADAVTNFTKMLNWPEAKLFPVLDLFRIIVKNEATFSSFDPTIKAKVLKAMINSTSAPNQLMTLRAFCNMLIHEQGKLFVEQNFTELMELTEKIEGGNGNFQIAFASFFYNMSIVLEKGPSEFSIALAIGIVKGLAWIKEFEALFKAYQTVGNLMSYGNPDVVSLIKSIDILKNSLVENKSCPYEKLAEISAELLEKLL